MKANIPKSWLTLPEKEKQIIYKLVLAEGFSEASRVIDLIPTADVVPSAEVERLQHILDCYALQYGTVKDQQSVIVKVKSEMLSEFLRMVENVCKYEERLSYEKIKDGIKRQIAMKGGAE